MLGGYQIIDMKGYEILYDAYNVGSLNNPSIKIPGIYELIKSVGSKPILVENLKIKLVKTEDDLGEVVTEVISEFSSPFFTPYLKRAFGKNILLELYTSSVALFFGGYGISQDAPYIILSVTEDDTISATI